MLQFYTIGVYGKTEDEFFESLVKENIDTFIDIRRRRAVRGSKYSFVNSKKLQVKLSNLGIKYIHVIELSPTNEIREYQKNADAINGINKRDRNELGEGFIKEYKRQILSNFKLFDLINQLKEGGTVKAALFCVEGMAEACHRSIVAEQIDKDFNLKSINL